MKISSRGKYALQAMLVLASNDSGLPVPLKEVSRASGVPQNYLQQIFIPLRKLGYVKGMKGANPGYMLHMPAENITAYMIFAATETSFTTIDFDEADQSQDAVSMKLWQGLNENIKKHLSDINLRDLSIEYKEYQKIELNYNFSI